MPTPIARVPEFTVVVVEKRVLADGVVSLLLRPADTRTLPRWQPGAHVDLLLAPGLERQYSLCGDPLDDELWRVAVLREPESRGGSALIHDDLACGAEIGVRGPRNNFALVDAGSYRFVAGGIGITPILPMIRVLTARHKPWTLLYGGRHERSMAFVDELQQLGDHITLWPEDVHGMLDLDSYLEGVDTTSAVYCCGPEGLLTAIEARAVDWPEDTLHIERFRPDQSLINRSAEQFEVVLASSGRVIAVPPGQSILDALEAVGVYVETSCREGTCGTCETVVIDGVPDHRDSVLTASEKQANDVMMICCSRSKTPRLVLDL